MRLRFILACAMLALIIFGGVTALSYTTGLYSDILDLLDAAHQDGEAAGKALSEAHVLWEKNLSLICTLTGDEHVDAINLGFARAFSFYEQKEALHEYLAAVAEIMSGIRHLQDYDFPSVRSIF